MIACFWVACLGIACERRRMPHLIGEPVVLINAPASRASNDRNGSTNTASSASAQVVCASEEALRYGVHPGQQLSAARSLCPDLIALPFDRETYATAAETLWDLYAIESSIVEPLSPEMCYVDLGDRDPAQRASHLSALIATRAGCPVYVGLGRSKFVAREAASRGPNSVKSAEKDHSPRPIVVHVGDELLFFANMPIARIPEVDRKSLLRLQKLGIATLGDIGRVPSHRIPRDLRQIGALLIQRTLGHDSDPMRPMWPLRPIEHHERFDEPLGDEAAIHAVIARLAARAAKALSNENRYCREVTLIVGFDDGSIQQERDRLRLPIADAAAISRAAIRMLRTIVIEQPVAELRLTISGIDAGSGIQLALLDEAASRSDGTLPHERRRRLDATIAAIRRRWGPGAIVPARTLRQSHRIGLWTYPFVHRVNQPIRVATDAAGRPVRYWAHERRCGQLGSAQVRQVTCVFDRWRERKWLHGQIGQIVDTTAYRVETSPWGISELQQIGVEWRLTGRSD